MLSAEVVKKGSAACLAAVSNRGIGTINRARALLNVTRASARKGTGMAQQQALEGTVRRLVSDRGFGFLRCNQSGLEYFFHRSMLSPASTRFELLKAGDPVRFVPSPDGEKGPRAEAVETI